MIKLNRILAPTDFSEYSQYALRYACEFADRFNAELHLLSVIHDTKEISGDVGLMSLDDFMVRLEADTSSQLDQQPDSPWAEKLTVVREVRIGNPFLEIIRYAKEKTTGLIVIGTHGRTGLSHVLLGSVAEKVVRKAPCPVLTIRHPEHEFVMP